MRGKITVCTNTNFTLNPSPILWIMFQVVLNGERYLYSQYRCMMEGEEREKLCDQVRFPSSGLCTHHSYIIQEEDTCIHRAGAQWKGEKGGLICSDWIFPFLYNLWHHSYIIQEKDNCIHKVEWLTAVKKLYLCIALRLNYYFIIYHKSFHHKILYWFDFLCLYMVVPLFTYSWG